ncbi:hypothetical protein VP01_658g4 [Puccinia sorghi]|uniref:Uncharacterized protein n=1 Tax=Puccinia sorghi TaxID=27349 RepID=A0A0L6UHD8_9BASI|nr:hypothetical protein VP01_658g4 [Puccinia sorghi]
MAITAHFIEEDFVMRDLTLAVPQVQGSISHGSCQLATMQSQAVIVQTEIN